MSSIDQNQPTPRRQFLGSIAAGTAALGIATLGAPFTIQAKETTNGNDSDADAWFNKIKGKHRMVFDVTRPHEVLPFAWPKVFLLTNEKTGTAEKDCGVVVV